MLQVASSTIFVLRAAGFDESVGCCLPADEGVAAQSQEFSDLLLTHAHSATSHLLASSATCAAIASDAVGLFLGTTMGSLETDRVFDRSRRDNARYASPAAFARTLPSTLAAQLALSFGLKGPSLVVSAGGHSAALALRRAAAWMRHFEMSHAIAGGFDEVGSNPDVPAICRLGFVLLTTVASAGALGRIVIEGGFCGQLEGVCDGSLERLIEWIRRGGGAELGGGVAIVPT